MISTADRTIAPTVMIVDDDEDSFMLLRRLLKRMGATEESNWFRDGEAAVSQLQQLVATNAPLPMLVLLDLRMPVMDGFDALRIIKESPKLRDLLVVVISSSDLPEDIARALQLGAFGYFEKYPTPEKFARVYEVAKARLRTNTDADPCATALRRIVARLEEAVRVVHSSREQCEKPDHVLLGMLSNIRHDARARLAERVSARVLSPNPNPCDAPHLN